MDLGLAGRRAIVTGGSKGLGQAIAAELIAEGASVAICSRHADELEATADELMKQAGAGLGVTGAQPGTVLVSFLTNIPCDDSDASMRYKTMAPNAAS